MIPVAIPPVIVMGVIWHRASLIDIRGRQGNTPGIVWRQGHQLILTHLRLVMREPPLQRLRIK